jgi:hypothetical protein
MQRNYIHGANFETALKQQGAATMIRLACFGAFSVAFALAGPAWGTGDVESVAAARPRVPVFAMDGSKVCRFGTSARPHPGLRLLAARITDGPAIHVVHFALN